MRATLTAAGPFSFTVNSPGVTIDLDGAAVPPPGPGPQPAAGFDLATQSALLEAWAKLDPIGQPDYAQLAPLGSEFVWHPFVAGFQRQGSCYRWTAGIVAPSTGLFKFHVKQKSGGSVIFDGKEIWSDDRELDPTSPSTYEVAWEATLEGGRVYPLAITTIYEGFLFGCVVTWQPPGSDVRPLSVFHLRPPADWQSRLKEYQPPPPEPMPYTVPDASYQSPELAGRLFPADSPWNTSIDQEPVDPLSDAIIARLGDIRLHPVFGVGHGLPFEVVPPETTKVSLTFDYAGESDAGPYPLPEKPVLESGGGDGHWLGIQGNTLYELFLVRKEGGQWKAGSGAIFDVVTGARVPGWKPGWTSADAAGLPILPGLVRPEEVAKGEIPHALRITLPFTRRAFVPPASHFASTKTDEDCAPMGCRLRLRADLDESAFPPQAIPIVRALKKYGCLVSDNGGNFIAVCGVPDRRWSDDELASLKTIKASDFQVTKMGPITTEVP